MKVGKAIYKILSENADVSALVSTRIRPNRIDFDESFPAISYYEISDDPNGTKYNPSELNHIFVQISCFSNTYSELIDLSEKVKKAFDYARGTFNGVNVSKIFYQDSNDLFDEDAGENGINYRVLDFKFNISTNQQNNLPISTNPRFWVATEFDDDTAYYWGGLNDGAWEIDKAPLTDVTNVTTANVSNNSSYTSLADAWSNRLTLNYV